MRRLLLKWEIIGTLFIIILGALLHFVFAWSGYCRPLALIAAVNESTWEHLKMAFWPAFIWAAVEYVRFGSRLPNLLVAKTASFYFTPFLIVVLVNIYTAITGFHLLVVEISIFLFAVIFRQAATHFFLSPSPLFPLANLSSLCLLVFIFGTFCVFTYYPPDLPLFINPHTGQPGIPN